METLLPNPVHRVVRFGVRAPTKRKAAVLDDALRRQTLAYGRALEAVRADAIRWLRADVQSRRKDLDSAARGELRRTVTQIRAAISSGAYYTAKQVSTSVVMANAVVQDVLATLTSWIGWRARFRAERPGRLRRAEEARTKALADMPAAIARLQARRRGATITADHVLASVEGRLTRERRRRPPAYPTGPRLKATEPNQALLLDSLAATTSKAEEDRLRDVLATQASTGLHPLLWAWPQSDPQGRGVNLFWDANRLFAFLPGLLPAEARRHAKPLNTVPKRLVSVEEPVRLKQTGGVILPLAFSRAAWVYLDGWTPRTARLIKVADRYELHMVFARRMKPAAVNPARWIGVDRGVVNIAAVADDAGEDAWVFGNQLAPLERRLRAQRETLQRKGGKRAMQVTRRQFRAAARNEINRIAKDIVARAVRRGAYVSAEDLAAFARGDARTLSQAQYGRLLAAIEAGLERAGYPPVAKGGKRVWLVRAAGTSQCCAACGHTSAANRPERDVFRCEACGHVADPDINAAVNIARRAKETSAILRDRAGRAEGSRASTREVVARPASAARTEKV